MYQRIGFVFFAFGKHHSAAGCSCVMCLLFYANTKNSMDLKVDCRAHKGGPKSDILPNRQLVALRPANKANYARLCLNEH